MDGGFDPIDWSKMPDGDARPKVEPNADMRQMATVAWQMYVSLTDIGFSKDEAMKLVSDILIAAVTNS
jgi:hypothetical protein